MVGEVDETKENLDLSDSESEYNYKVKENLCFSDDESEGTENLDLSDSGGEDEVKENLGFSDSDSEVKENLDLSDDESEGTENLCFSDSDSEVKENLDLSDDESEGTENLCFSDSNMSDHNELSKDEYYEQKYLKYKLKYLYLKATQQGGNVDNSLLKNLTGGDGEETSDEAPVEDQMEVKENLGFSDSEDEVKENLDLTDICDMYKMKISKLEALVEELKVQLNEKVVVIDEEDDEIINKDSALIEFNEYYFEACGRYEQMKNLRKNIGWNWDGDVKTFKLKKHHLDIFKYIKNGQLDKLKETCQKYGLDYIGYSSIRSGLADKYNHPDIINYLRYNCS